MKYNDLISEGSVHDIKNGIACSWDAIDIPYLQAALVYEQGHDKRASVIKLIESAIKRKRKEANRG